MQPDFTRFDFEKPVVPDGEVVQPFNRSIAKFSLKVEWKEDGKASAPSCLITSPDMQVWRVTAERVKKDD